MTAKAKVRRRTRATVTVTDESAAGRRVEVYSASFIVSVCQSAVSAGWAFLGKMDVNPCRSRSAVSRSNFNPTSSSERGKS